RARRALLRRTARGRGRRRGRQLAARRVRRRLGRARRAARPRDGARRADHRVPHARARPRADLHADDVGTAAVRRSERGPSGAAARWRTPQTWDDRLSDRCNAVLARDLTQAINGRGWTLATLGVSVVVGIVLLDGSPEGGAEAGRAMLTRLFGLLLFVLWFLMPFRTFTAMREEVTGETREHLLLSGLSAKSVVVGKVAAALLLALGQLGIVAPLLALAWAVGTGSFAGLSIALWVTLLGSLAWSTLAVGFGTLAPRFRPRALPIPAAGVGLAAVGRGEGRQCARLLEDSRQYAGPHL